MTVSEELYVASLKAQIKGLMELNELQGRQIERLTQLLEDAGVI